MSQSNLPSPISSLTITQQGDVAEVSWTPGWATIPGPWVGPHYHTITLYVSELPSASADAHIQVQINGVSQLSNTPKVTGIRAQQIDEVLTFTGTWASPPNVAVIGHNLTPGLVEMWLDAATYDGQELAGVTHHFTQNLETYTFVS